LDRFVMLLVKADNIREVIAFPKMKDASCLMSEAPGTVDPKQLRSLRWRLLRRRRQKRLLRSSW